MKQIHIKLNDNNHTQLRKHCAELDISIQNFVMQNLHLALTKPKVNNSSFKFIDLFAGIGGIRLPYQELKGECVFSSEIDKYAKMTYQSYYDDMPHGDIHTITPCEIPDFDILLAGFPCQPFSQAGHKQGFNDTRGTMFFQIEKIIRCKMPKAFLLENVKGLKGHDKGRTFKIIIETLESIGYTVKSEILAAKDFNLPQNRQRIYIAGFLDSLQGDKFAFPLPIEKTVKFGDILEKNVDSKYTISDKLWEGHQRRKEMHAVKGNGFGYSLFNGESEYVNTLSARYYKDGSEILIEQKNANPRKLTPLEAARLQGFPDQIVIEAKKAGVSDVQLYKQFGNSVAVNVIRHISRNMINAMGINS
jgi:DNA (cytosine-5)-methyltransferase 1